MNIVTFEDLQIKGEQMMGKVQEYTALIVDKIYRGDITLRNKWEDRDYWVSVVGGHKCLGDGHFTWEVAIFDDNGNNVTHKFYPNVDKRENVAPYLTKNAVTILMQHVIDGKPSNIIF